MKINMTDYLRIILFFSIFTLFSLNSFALSTFENDGFNSCSTGLADHWHKQVRGHELSLDRNVKTEGCASLKLSSDNPQSGSLVYQSVTPSLLAEGIHVFSGKIKTSDIKTSATLVVVVKGEGGKLFQDDMRDRKIHGTTDWQSYQITIPKLVDATSVKIGVVVIGPGTAWFDDLAVEQKQTKSVTSTVVTAYLDEVYSVLQAQHVNRKTIDWAGVRNAGNSAAEGMQTIDQAYAAARAAIQKLDDGHSRLVFDSKTAPSRIEGGSIYGHELEPNIGYIAVEGFDGASNGLEARRYAKKGHEIIHSLESAGVCGWVVDLRQNTGGNMWPMIAAVGPLLGEGVHGFHNGAEPSDRVEWIYQAGKAISRKTSSGETKVKTDASSNKYPSIDTLPVALLIGNNTASSGEALTVAFLGRENVRSFGRPTSGATTGRILIPLSNGSKIALAVSNFAGSQGTIYTEAISPEISLPNDMSQPAIESAVKWLKGEKPCLSLERVTSVY